MFLHPLEGGIESFCNLKSSGHKCTETCNFYLPLLFIFQIPLIKLAQSVYGNKPIKLYASPWTAPSWMKSNGELTGQGYLLPEYYPTWANYFIKFLDHYKNHEVEFWGLTAQNEPWNGLAPNFPFNAMGWNASMQREWIVNHLGPRLYILS